MEDRTQRTAQDPRDRRLRRAFQKEGLARLCTCTQHTSTPDQTCHRQVVPRHLILRAPRQGSEQREWWGHRENRERRTQGAQILAEGVCLTAGRLSHTLATPSNTKGNLKQSERHVRVSPTMVWNSTSWRGWRARDRFQSALAAIFAHLITATCASCGSDVSLSTEAADAEVYIRAVCEDRCAKWDDCAPVPVSAERCSIQECIDFQWAGLYDPCFAEEDEFFRCRVERLTCSEFFDLNIETSPGSACYEFLVLASECRLRHPAPASRN